MWGGGRAPQDIKNVIRLRIDEKVGNHFRISRRESSVNTRLGSDQHQLIMPPISKDCSNTFLERSFIYAPLHVNGTN